MTHKKGKGHTGIQHTQKSKEKISDSLKKRYAIFGHPRIGKKHSKLTREKISYTKKDVKDSIVTKQKKSEAKKGSKNPMFGKSCSEDRRRKISEANTGHKFDGEICPKCNKIHPDITGKNNPTKPGKLNPFYGKHHTEETLNKHRGENNSSKRPSVKRKMRESAIKRIEKQLNNKQPLMPSIGNYETLALNNLEQCFGYKIERQKRVAGYFLDGYCSMLKLAIEIDEPNHFIRGRLRKRDLQRQNENENEIGCMFLRIKVPNKQNI